MWKGEEKVRVMQVKRWARSGSSRLGHRHGAHGHKSELTQQLSRQSLTSRPDCAACLDLYAFSGAACPLPTRRQHVPKLESVPISDSPLSSRGSWVQSMTRQPVGQSSQAIP